MSAYFLVILPLPDVKTVDELTSAWVQLVPLREVAELFKILSGMPRASASRYVHPVVRCDGF